MEILPRFIIEDDDLDLLWRFTAWMEQAVRHSKADYLRKQGRRQKEVHIEQPDIAESAVYEAPLPFSPGEFDFEEEKLANAFSRLALLRRQILTLIFVDDLSAQEVADKLGCPVGYVYLQKHRALKALRDQLMEGGR